jgi:hypothetical protein
MIARLRTVWLARRLRPIESRGLTRATLVWLTVLITVIGAYFFYVRFGLWARLGILGVDHAMFLEDGRRWLETGTMYLPYQLEGRYAHDIGSGTPNVAIMPALYPPIAGPVFAAWRFLPDALWWAIPIAVLAYALVRWRPSLWAWPLIVEALLWTNTADAVLAGGSNMWVVAGLAGGLIWGWPAALIAFKPSFVPFMLVGAGRRSWWIAVGLVIILALAMLPEWFRYVTVLRNVQSPGLLYSVGGLPLLLVPVIAWVARRAPAERTRLSIPWELRQQESRRNQVREGSPGRRASDRGE